MAHHRGVARDEYGNSISGATVTVYAAGSTTASTIYSEGTLTTAEDNPFETGDDGVYEFFCEPGLYDIQIARSGFTGVTLENVMVGHVFGHLKYTGTEQETLTGTAIPIDVNWGSATLDGDAQSGFEVTALDRLKYVGEDTIWCRVEARITLESDLTRYITSDLIHDDGSAASFGVSASGTVTGTESRFFAVSGIIQLDTDDEVYANINGGTAALITLYEFELFIQGMS